MSVGKAAVLAEIEQSWTSILEPRLQEQGGVVFRRFRIDVVEDQLLQESKQLERQLEILRGDLAGANATNRAALQKSVQSVNQELVTIRDRAKTEMDRRKAETDLKVKKCFVVRPKQPWRTQRLGYKNVLQTRKRISRCVRKGSLKRATGQLS